MTRSPGIATRLQRLRTALVRGYLLFGPSGSTAVQKSDGCFGRPYIARITAGSRICPVKLLAIAAGDLFFSDEIDGISSHLGQRLREELSSDAVAMKLSLTLIRLAVPPAVASWQGRIWLQDMPGV